MHVRTFADGASLGEGGRVGPSLGEGGELFGYVFFFVAGGSDVGDATSGGGIVDDGSGGCACSVESVGSLAAGVPVCPHKSNGRGRISRCTSGPSESSSLALGDHSVWVAASVHVAGGAGAPDGFCSPSDGTGSVPICGGCAGGGVTGD